MLYRSRLLLLVFPVLLGLQACSSVPGGAPVEGRSEAAGSGYAPPPTEDVAVAERPAPVRRLLRSAEVQAGSGRYTVAASTLERALRISPKDALIWQRLAVVRFDQGRWQLAIQMAAKSNSLAVGDDENMRRLRRANWELIARAHQQLGNTAGAEAARKRASEISETL